METMMSDPKYPRIHVPLSGEDGNALSIIGRVGLAMRRAGVPRDEIDRFREEAMSGDYNNVLRTVMRTVSVS
jgi:hypothetical protein